MEIKDLQIRQGDIELTAEVTEKTDARQFDKFGQVGKVATATIKDATGIIKLSLWNEQIEQVNVGDTVHITNGYVKEFKGEKQITTGRNGTIEIVKTSAVYSNIAPKNEDEPSVDNDEPILDDDDIVL